jgi:hypothetical protein
MQSMQLDKLDAAELFLFFKQRRNKRRRCSILLFRSDRILWVHSVVGSELQTLEVNGRNIHECTPAIALCQHHWVYICQSKGGNLILMDSVLHPDFWHKNYLAAMNIESSYLNKQPYQQFSERDAYCGVYCVFFHDMYTEECGGLVSQLELCVNDYLTPFAFDVNLEKMQIYAVKMEIGSEFHSTEIIKFMKLVKSLQAHH